MITRCLLFFIISLYTLTLGAQNFKLGKPIDSLVLQQEHPVYKKASSAIINKVIDYQIIENYNGELELSQTFTIRLKRYNSPNTSQISIPLLVGDKVSKVKVFQVYSKDGEILKERLDKDKIIVEKDTDGTVALQINTDPIVGSIVDYTYTVKSSFVDVPPAVFFQDYIPVDNLSFSFKTPKYLEYFFYKNGEVPYQIYRNGKLLNLKTSRLLDNKISSYSSNINTEYNIKLKEISPYPKHDLAGSFANFASGIKMQLGYTFDLENGIEPVAQTWEQFAQMLFEHEHFGQQINNVSFLDNLSKTFKTSYTNPFERLKAIFSYVQQRMNWNGNYGILTENGVKPSFLSLNGNVADINLLLLTLLRNSGLTAHPVLVSTKFNGLSQFPSLYSFDYLLIKVIIDTEEYILDASSKLTNLNILEEETINIRGLELNKDAEPLWVNLYQNSTNSIDIFSELNLDKTKIKGEIKMRYSGNAVLRVKRKLDLKHELAKEEFPNLTIVQTTLENSNDTYFKKFITIESPISSKNNSLILKTKPLFYQTDLHQEANLQTIPVDLSFPKSNRQVINITIPSNYTLAKLPQNVELISANTGIKCTLNFKIDDNILQITRFITYAKPLIENEHLAELSLLISKIQNIEATTLTFNAE